MQHCLTAKVADIQTAFKLKIFNLAGPGCKRLDFPRVHSIILGQGGSALSRVARFRCFTGYKRDLRGSTWSDPVRCESGVAKGELTADRTGYRSSHYTRFLLTQARRLSSTFPKNPSREAADRRTCTGTTEKRSKYGNLISRTGSSTLINSSRKTPEAAALSKTDSFFARHCLGMHFIRNF